MLGAEVDFLQIEADVVVFGGGLDSVMVGLVGLDDDAPTEETATRTIPTETVTYRYETVNEQYPVEVTTLEPYTEYLEQQKVVSEWVPVGESAVSKKPALKMEKVDAADRPPVLSDQEARKAADEGAPVQKKVDQDSSDSGKASSGEPAKKE